LHLTNIFIWVLSNVLLGTTHVSPVCRLKLLVYGGGGYNLNSHNLSERLLEVIQLRVLKLYKIV